jgi:hypothetical protein
VECLCWLLCSTKQKPSGVAVKCKRIATCTSQQSQRILFDYWFTQRHHLHSDNGIIHPPLILCKPLYVDNLKSQKYAYNKTMISCEDSLSFLKKLKDFSVDVNYSDPPYGLGSEIIIRPDGKPDYSNAADFMSKWDAPTGDYWQDWFQESFRTLKYGGHLIMFGMDRQLLLHKYYASLAGFTEKQSMYWYTISGFPKATDLNKQILKTIEREAKSQLGVDIEWE